MINLTGEIYFPNVHIETNLVDFGCILNNTEVFQDVKITNIGPLIVNYKWKFVYETDNIVANYIKQDDALSKQISSHENLFDIELNNSDGVTSPGMETIPTTDDLSQSTKPTAVKPADIDLPSIEEIFDISPLYGTLHPGESQKLRVNYFGHKEIKAYVRAICEIKNGPNYEMMIKGEASVLNYEISDYTIHFDYIVIFFLYVIVNTNEANINFY
jgi:hydrocephalus-inducing protein